jgi:hypothetical protein
VGGFAKELHGTGTEALQGFKKDFTERISRAVLVDKVVPALVRKPKSRGVARGVGVGTNVGRICCGCMCSERRVVATETVACRCRKVETD